MAVVCYATQFCPTCQKFLPNRKWQHETECRREKLMKDFQTAANKIELMDEIIKEITGVKYDDWERYRYKQWPKL